MDVRQTQGTDRGHAANNLVVVERCADNSAALEFREHGGEEGMAAKKTRKPVAGSGAHTHRKSLRLHGSIARDLGVLIVSGRYRPGHILDGEVEASEQRRVSRTAYREALRILAAKGLVNSRPRVGTRVSALEQWHLLDPDVLVLGFFG